MDDQRLCVLKVKIYWYLMTNSETNVYDRKAAVAGEISSEPELNTVDEVAKEAGVELPVGETVGTKSMLQDRDEHRWELDPNSAEEMS